MGIFPRKNRGGRTQRVEDSDEEFLHYYGLNNHEKEIAQQYEQQGYKWLHKGWPDLMLWNENTNHIIAIETKNHNDKLSAEQAKMIELLRKTGLEVIIIWKDLTHTHPPIP